MKIKYAIYKNKVGLRAVEYADTKMGIKDFPYIKESSLPVIINSVGGYSSFDLEYEKEKGFIKIIEIDDDKEPLTREEMYPKNSSSFEYGWISPEGDTYNTGHEGHRSSADKICEELGIDVYNGERYLEEKGWVKITASWDKGELKKRVFVEDLYITKKQAETMFDLGLWDVEHMAFLVKRSEPKW